LRDYLIKDIKAYQTTEANRKFERRRIHPDHNTDLILIPVFVEVLASTQTHSLYFYKNSAIDKRFFIETEEIDFLELKAEAKSKTIKGLVHDYTNKKYIGLLKAAFAPCAYSETMDLDNLEFKRVRIAQAFIKLSEYAGQELLFTSPLC
jgi:hypothetical protein